MTVSNCWDIQAELNSWLTAGHVEHAELLQLQLIIHEWPLPQSLTENMQIFPSHTHTQRHTTSLNEYAWDICSCVLLFVSLLAIVHWEFIWISFSLIFISFWFSFFVPMSKIWTVCHFNWISMPRLGKKCTTKSEWGKKHCNLCIWARQDGNEEGGLVKKSQKAQNILHKFAYNCLNLAWCCTSRYIHMACGTRELRAELATCKTCPTYRKHNTCNSSSICCHNWEPAANSRFLDNVVLYVPPAWYASSCMLTISCTENVFLYLQLSHLAALNTAMPSTLRPLLVSPQKPLMRNSRCKCCCKSLAASCFPLTTHCPLPHLVGHSTGKSAWAVYMRVMFVACFQSYVKHLTPSKWMPVPLPLLLLWQSAHDNSLIENIFLFARNREGDRNPFTVQRG